MVKIEVAKAIIFYRYFTISIETIIISIENNKKSIKTGDFLEVLANNNYSVKSLDTLKLVEIGEKIGDETIENQIFNNLFKFYFLFH